MGPPPGDRMGPPLAGEQDQRRGWLRHRRTGQGPHLGDWLRKNRNLSPEEQDRMLANDAHFQQLPPEAQQRLRERLREFNNLSPEEQDRILDRMDRFGHLTPEQQKRAREMVRRMRALPEERRRKIHQTFGELRGLAPEEREGKLNSEPLSTELSSEERDLLREMFTLPPPPRRGPRGERGERPPEGEAPPPF
jgi:DNA-directed RNA polymerase subunit F